VIRDNNHVQGRRNVGRTGRAEKKLRAMETYEEQKKSLPIIRPVTSRGLATPENNFAPPGKMCWR